MTKPRHIYAAHMDIVHGCQLRCVGCPNSTLLPKIKRVSVEDFGTYLRNIDVEKINTLRLFNYGEPLLHRDLPGIVAEIPKQSWKVSIVEISTNAQWVDWDNFAEMLKLEVVNRLVVSCDGDGSPEQYERLRPPAKWEKLLEFLDRARALRDRWSPATQLVTKTIVDKREDALRWDSVLRPRGWVPEYRGWMALPESVENRTGREIEPPAGACMFMAEPAEFTDHPWFGEVRLLYVDADGTVVPCCIHPQAGVFGNLKVQRFSEILAAPERAAFKAEMNRDRKAMKICGSCEMGPVGAEGKSFWSAMTPPEQPF